MSNSRTIEQALSLLGSMSVMQISEITGFHSSYIKSAAYSRGLATAFIRRAWSEDDLAFLKINASTMPICEIAQMLGRGVSAVRAVALKHKISLQKQGNIEAIQNIATLTFIYVVSCMPLD